MEGPLKRTHVGYGTILFNYVLHQLSRSHFFGQKQAELKHLVSVVSSGQIVILLFDFQGEFHPLEVGWVGIGKGGDIGSDDEGSVFSF